MVDVVGSFRISRLFAPLPTLLCLLHLPLFLATNECQPATWAVEGDIAAFAMAAPTPVATDAPWITGWDRRLEPGELNCRRTFSTTDNIDDFSCQRIANLFLITVEEFFRINPGLDPSCENLQPYTTYCVDGYFEPLRAYDGNCGPMHGGATCVGAEQGRCCNSRTWTCGNSEEDCANGICWEGACYGDSVFTTNGKCGVENGYKLCSGPWGNCCSVFGVCGTGEDFCGPGKCQSGDCDVPNVYYPPRYAYNEEGKPYKYVGNTTDGTCGGPNNYLCDDAHGGPCCNKDNICGFTDDDCIIDRGCQKKFGICDRVPWTGLPTSTVPPEIPETSQTSSMTSSANS